MPNLDKFIQNLARRAGRVLQKHFGKAPVVRAKLNPTDVVTEADLAAERLIIRTIDYPHHT